MEKSASFAPTHFAQPQVDYLLKLHAYPAWILTPRPNKVCQMSIARLQHSRKQ
jgi:hypothetical protein